MARKVTICTGQFADLPFEKVCEMMSGFGYDGLEVATWGDILNIEKAASSKQYCQDKLATLKKYNLGAWALQGHLSGQLLCDELDERHNPFAPEKVRGDFKAMRQWAISVQKKLPKAARNMGVDIVTNFTGSPIWKYLYSFPPVLPKQISEGYKQMAKTMKPILDVFADYGVKFALEVHPTEIAFDIASAERTLDALGGHPAFGFNFDPSHLGYQGVDYVKFIRTFPDRIFHVHMKDAWWGHGDGSVGVFGGHVDFGDPRRYWDFRSLGHGDVNFEEIIVALNDIGYNGPLSVEWEDMRMDREYGAKEALEFVRKIDFPRSNIAFDGQFESK